MKKKVTLKGKTILAVDDEPDILESIQDVLEGCHVDTAQDYGSAMELLNSKPTIWPCSISWAFKAMIC